MLELESYVLYNNCPSIRNFLKNQHTSEAGDDVSLPSIK